MPQGYTSLTSLRCTRKKRYDPSALEWNVVFIERVKRVQLHLCMEHQFDTFTKGSNYTKVLTK